MGGWVAWSNLVSAQGPLVLGLGLRVWGQGLTIRKKFRFDHTNGQTDPAQVQVLSCAFAAKNLGSHQIENFPNFIQKTPTLLSSVISVEEIL